MKQNPPHHWPHLKDETVIRGLKVPENEEDQQRRSSIRGGRARGLGSSFKSVVIDPIARSFTVDREKPEWLTQLSMQDPDDDYESNADDDGRATATRRGSEDSGLKDDSSNSNSQSIHTMNSGRMLIHMMTDILDKDFWKSPHEPGHSHSNKPRYESRRAVKPAVQTMETRYRSPPERNKVIWIALLLLAIIVGTVLLVTTDVGEHIIKDMRHARGVTVEWMGGWKNKSSVGGRRLKRVLR